MDKQKILSNLNVPKFYQEFIPSLKVNGKPEALGLCPFHDDHSPSLSVNVATGFFHCFSCDAKGDIFTFYQRYKDTDFPTTLKEIAEMTGTVTASKTKVVATFKYYDSEGKLLYIKERLEPGRNGKPKEFVFKHPEGNKWVLGRGCDPVLYNLPQLNKSNYCFIVEGEAKVDLLTKWGLTATCLDSGANSPVKDEYIQILGAKEKVIILPDNDAPGKSYAAKIASVLHGKAKELKVVGLPGLKETEDIIGWVKVVGNTKEKLLEIIKNAPLWTPKECNETAGFDITKALRIGAELQVLDLPVNWAVKGLLPQQAITLLSARGGMGKTILSISISDAVTRGIPFLGLETVKMPVVYIDFENSLPTLIERIRRIDASNVLFWHPTNEIKPPRLDSKEYALYKKLPQGALLIFDTLRASQSRDENDSQHMAMIMLRLKELRDLGFTILILHHTAKSNDRIYKGSTAIFDLCDHNLSLHKVKKGSYTPDEASENDSEDSEDYCYRLGTRDKTRYEPFSIFLEFDIERGCFIIAPDPDTETLEEIHSLLVGKESLNTSDIFEIVKKEMNIKSKGKLLKLLKKGGGKYWNSENRGKGKPTCYKVTCPPVPLYIHGQVDNPAATCPDEKDRLSQKRLDSPDFTDLSSCPAHSQTGWTGQGVTCPDHFEKSRPVETSPKPVVDVSFEVKNEAIEIPEIEFIEEVKTNV